VPACPVHASQIFISRRQLKKDKKTTISALEFLLSFLIYHVSVSSPRSVYLTCFSLSHYMHLTTLSTLSRSQRCLYRIYHSSSVILFLFLFIPVFLIIHTFSIYSLSLFLTPPPPTRSTFCRLTAFISFLHFLTTALSERSSVFLATIQLVTAAIKVRLR
jgi:hypothetical protein